MQVYGIIYMIRNNVNGKIYFGQTIKKKGFKGRYENGEWWRFSDNSHLKNSAEKYGHENFTVIEEFDVAYSKQELDLLEDLYICMYDTMNRQFGYNKRRGGSHGKLSQESKDKIAQKVGGELNPMYGKKHSDETKRIISEKQTGRFVGEKSYMYGKKKPAEQIEKMKQTRKQKGLDASELNPMYGKEHSDEAKAKMSANSACAKKVICINTQQTFPSAAKAAQYFGIKYNLYVNRACKNKTYTVHPITKEKLYFEFIDEQ